MVSWLSRQPRNKEKGGLISASKTRRRPPGSCQQALGLVAPAKVSFQNAREFSPHSREADAALRKLYQVGFWEKLLGRWRRRFHA